jgi:dihydrofolate reductase
MSAVVWHVTMSLDGFITGPDDAMEWAFAVSGPSAMADEVMNSTGAIVAGRRWFDVATSRYSGVAGIYGGAWTGPVFVLTHRPAEIQDDPTVTVCSDGIANAVAAARRAAGDKNVEIFGANTAHQSLDAGLLDEIAVHIAPVMLGDGVRFYGGPDAATVALERTELAASGPMTDLRFAVVR